MACTEPLAGTFVLKLSHYAWTLEYGLHSSILVYCFAISYAKCRGPLSPFVLPLALCRIAIISILNIHYKTATSEFPYRFDWLLEWLVGLSCAAIVALHPWVSFGIVLHILNRIWIGIGSALSQGRGVSFILREAACMLVTWELRLFPFSCHLITKLIENRNVWMKFAWPGMVGFSSGPPCQAAARRFLFQYWNRSLNYL